MADRIDHEYVRGTNRIGRLGDVLGVDFSPYKVCSFNCRYCGVGPTTRKTLDREAFYPVEDVFGQVRDYIEENGEPDYCLLTGSGEPALYSGFGRLATAIKESFPDVRQTIYTNGSLLHRADVRDEVAVCDLVMINLNAAEERAFRRICRPHPGVELDRLVGGIKQFRQQYDGPVWMDAVLVKGINDSEDVLEGLMGAVVDIGPDLFRVRTVRQPVEGVAEPVPAELAGWLKERWGDAPFEVEYAL
jgi:wyosine [tRNA(Phe)-imidazoG37] synthetase (radical SAM superfamily)